MDFEDFLQFLIENPDARLEFCGLEKENEVPGLAVTLVHRGHYRIRAVIAKDVLEHFKDNKGLVLGTYLEKMKKDLFGDRRTPARLSS